MNTYEMKQEARRQRLLAIAARLEREGNARYARAKALADVIPFGQPILVGHHSEGRDRRYRAKIHGNFSKAFAAQEAAKRVAAKAEAVGTGGVSSDDPDAVAKLSAQVTALETMQTRMRAANAAIRRHKKAGAQSQVAALVAMGYAEDVAVKLLQPDFCGRIGYPDYAMTNNNANIKRIKARIAALSVVAAQADAPSEEIDCGAYTVVKNFGANRVQVVFPGKPDYAVREVLKRSGFRWSPTEGAWQRMMNAGVVQHLVSGYLRADIERACAR